MLAITNLLYQCQKKRRKTGASASIRRTNYSNKIYWSECPRAPEYFIIIFKIIFIMRRQFSSASQKNSSVTSFFFPSVSENDYFRLPQFFFTRTLEERMDGAWWKSTLRLLLYPFYPDTVAAAAGCLSCHTCKALRIPFFIANTNHIRETNWMFTICGEWVVRLWIHIIRTLSM